MMPKVVYRCHSCKKKVGLTGFNCKCGRMFCGMHRYAETHECTFDYKRTAADQIAKTNPRVKEDKLVRFSDVHFHALAKHAYDYGKN